MTRELTYRNATINDLQQLKELNLLAYGEFAHVLTPENWAIMETNLKDEGRLLTLVEKATIFAGVHTGRIVGTAYLVPHGNPTPVYPADWSYIRSVGVHPDYRGLGIAKHLTRQCIDRAKETGEQIIGLHTSEIMDAARKVYEQLGFKIVKEIDPIFGVRYWLYSLQIS